MNTVTILLLAVGLSMDAFAVSLSCGLTDPVNRHKNAIKCGIAFGLFQGFMTFLGYLLGQSLIVYIEAFDHWIAFILLAIVGGHMIYESFGSIKKVNLNSYKVLLTLSIATSIDALAAGLSLSTLNTPMLLPSLSIGIITCILSIIGVNIGAILANTKKVSSYADRFGGLVLIGIGIKILIEHLTA